VMSDVPALVLGGTFDPITPPEFGRVAAETLTNSYFFEFPGLAHGVSTAHECPLAMTLAFLDDPSREPDGSCISEIDPPRFLTPGRLAVDLVPFEEEIFGLTVSGVVPEGWDEAGFGQYTAPGLGDTAIVQQARDVDPGLTIDSMAAGIGDFFEIPAWDRSTVTLDRTWELFEGFDGEVMFLMGLTEDDGRLLMVILAAPIDVFEDYRELVFIPALEAIEVTG
ncbi:MAG: alpha/beta hydrolase, partial [Halobacteriales archaeon]|nr:alpha/beta hydrolase [Halobacteriales archaeon]